MLPPPHPRGGEDLTRQRHSPAHIIVFVGPSGCGKSTLADEIMKRWPNRFAFSVSHTTRKPRKNEVNGKHYHFVSKEKFLQLLADGLFAEHSKSFTKAKRNTSDDCGPRGSGAEEDDEDTVYYGTSKMALHDVLSNGRIVLMDTDISGAIKIKRYCDEINTQLTGKTEQSVVQSNAGVIRRLQLHLIFVKCPNLEVGEQRLRDRGTETVTSLQRRFLSNRQCIQWYNAHTGFFNLTLVNDTLERCLEDLFSYVSGKILCSPSSKL